MNPSDATRIPQLDSLRAIAVIGVVFSHSIAQENTLNTFFSGVGSIGVRLFFVISGFLITLILMRSKDHSDLNSTTILKTFYIRRTLRIFPLYYFSLLVLCFLSWSVMRETIAWHIFFTTNIYQTVFNDWTVWTAHYWSLAVEEQFYLFWPFLIIYSSARWRLIIIVMAVLLAQLYRLSIGISAEGELDGLLLLPAQMDSLGLGALLAFLTHYNVTIPKIYALFGIIIFFLIGTISTIIDYKTDIVTYSVVPFILLGITYLTIHLNHRWMLGLFTLPPIVYIGKISFGIYIWHPLIIRVISNKFFIENSYTLFAIAVFLSILVSSLSWYILEHPINKLKYKFSY